MARPVRPASENYQPAYCSVSQSFSYSSATGTEGLEDEDDKAPIFSLSKSSMDVVMATGPPHKRDPAWTRMDMRRSSSTNTHSEQHPHMLQEINNVQAPLTAQHLDTHGRAISDRWLANLERWSGCSSSSTHSRSSTPDTVVWKGVLSRPCSLTQEAFCSSAPDSPMSKGPSSPTTPSPFISPLQTPSLSVEDPLTSFPFPHQQGDSPTTSPVPSPQPAHTTSPLPSPLQAPITSSLQTPTISPLPSPLQATTNSPLPSPLQAPTTSPLQTPTISPLPSPLQAPTTSPLQAPTISPLPSPLQTPTISPLPSPLQATTTSPLPSPLQATTTSPLPSPLQAPTISHLQAPTTSPLQSPTISPLPSPLQAPTTSPLLSPLQAPTTSPLQTPTISPLPSPLQAPTTSPLPSPLQAPTTSPLPSNSPNVLQLTETDNEGFLENSLLSFQYLSPITSSVSLQEGVSSSDPGCLVDGLIEELPEPEGIKLSEGEGMRSPVLMSSDLTPNLAGERQESGGGTSICHLQLPWELGQRSWRSPLVSSLSDSQLCECSFASSKGITQAPRVEVFREEGTMTSRLELVDVAVQTVSPPNSWWDLRRNISSNMGSHSILGSPPGSRLNLRSPVGSHSNLVSPSSSMFPGSSDEEEEPQGDDPTWDVNSATSNHLERRRSCLKIHGDIREELGRRSSMKQVQWDEDGMTWEVHGASLDPEVLSTAIRKHLELKNSPQPPRRSSKKKKAPKPPRISNVVKAMTPELDPPVMTVTSNCLVERESKETLGAEEGKEAEKEGESKKEETVEDARKTSGAEGENAKEKEEEVCGEEGQPKSPSRGSAISRKRSVIRSLKRPGWCGSSRKTDD